LVRELDLQVDLQEDHLDQVVVVVLQVSFLALVVVVLQVCLRGLQVKSFLWFLMLRYHCLRYSF
jgi:hypothetical protein